METTDRDRVDERLAMVRAISAEVAATARWLGRSALSSEVADAMSTVPRHCFVPSETQAMAYENRPLRIGCGQTISQPYIVAIMSELAEIEPGDRVLEIGTGCGYQSAVLAELGARVYSVERIAQLADSARERLESLGYGDRVEVHSADGARGWPEHAPYDAIVVTAATNPAVVAGLSEQLAPGGRMVVPETHQARHGESRGILSLGHWLTGEPETDLCVIAKDEDGVCTQTRLLPVAFVPLVEGDPD